MIGQTPRLLSRSLPMPRLLSACLAALVVAFPSFAADGKKITLRWYGQSFFVLESSQGTRVVFDPHAIEAYGRVTTKADLVLVSHMHDDHSQVGVIENRGRARVLFGLKQDGRRLDWNPVDEK